jgi:trans-aconitate methyltransferase
VNYSAEYFDQYYGGSYEATFLAGFPLERILTKEWASKYKKPPQSFADLGCGCGQTLQLARKLLPQADLIYGVEVQEIPQERLVDKGVILGDFMDIYLQLPSVDLLYVSCSMYVPWPQQHDFLLAVCALAKKGVIFANLYLEDGRAIPNDILRTVIYKSRAGFNQAMSALGFVAGGGREIDFFTPMSKN